MWAAITSHAHIWGFHGNVHIAWGVYYIGIIILHLIPCTLQNIDESVPVCLELKLCKSHTLVRLSPRPNVINNTTAHAQKRDVHVT